MSLLHLNTSYEKLQDLVIYDFDIARFSIYKILITNFFAYEKIFFVSDP
jgi:hypothetical protein